MNLKFLFSLILGLALGSSVLASAEYEEQSYEDLVNQLQQRKKRAEPLAPSSLDHLAIHAGVGLISSVNRIEIDTRIGDRVLNGFQISLGIDLFSPEWVSEFVLRNFGTSERGFETRSLREADLRVFYRGPLSARLGYRTGAGIGTRYFKLRNPLLNLNISEETPCGMLFGGFEAYLNKNVSLGAELGFRSALLSRSVDKSAFDFMVRLDTFF